MFRFVKHSASVFVMNHPYASVRADIDRPSLTVVRVIYPPGREPMPVRTNSLQSPPTRPAAMNLLILARDQLKLYGRLQRRVGDCTGVVLIFDRREEDRRQAVQPVPVDRRQGERRSALQPTNDLRQRKYIFARPHARCPRD